MILLESYIKTSLDVDRALHHSSILPRYTMPRAAPADPPLTRKQKHEQLMASLVKFPNIELLPDSLDLEQKLWLNDYIGERFTARIGSRGQKTDNARTWTHDLVVGAMCDEKYPHLNQAEREQLETIIGDVSLCSLFSLYFCVCLRPCLG
jgi:hypothetical protein